MLRKEPGSSTNRHRRIILRVLGAGASLTVLLAAFLLALPSLVNHSSIRDKIAAKASEKLGAQIEYERVDLFYFPQPHLVLRQGKVTLPGGFAATIESLAVYPRVLPLLKGRIRISTMRLESPNLRTELPRAAGEGRGEQKKELPGDWLKKAGSVLASVASKTGSLTLEVDRGSAVLSEGDRPPIRIQDVRSRIVLSPDRVRMDLSCQSNLWEKMTVKASIETANLKGQGHVDLVHFRPHRLTDSLVSIAPLRIQDSAVNLTVDFRTEGPDTFQAEVAGSIPLLSLSRGNEEMTIRGKVLKGILLAEGERMEVALSQLDLDDPKLRLAGKVKIDRKDPQVFLEVESREMDVASARQTALKLAGHLPVVQTIFSIVKGGQVPLITFQSRGRSAEDLDETKNFTIRGSLAEGRISVPSGGFGWEGDGLDLDQVNGEVLISQGVLRGEKVSARWREEEVRDGQVTVGLEGKDAPLRLEFGVEADLSRLPAVLSRVIRDPAFLVELSRVDDLQGRAAGRLVLGDTMQSIGVKVEVREMNLAARYERLPYPVRIDQGQFSFDGTGIGLKGVSGRMGMSSFSGFDLQLGLDGEPALKALSGEFSISMEEIHPWLVSFEGLRESLKEIDSIRGTLGLAVKDLRGPVQEPSRLRFEATGEVKDCSVKSSLFPEPMGVAAGTFSASAESLSFTEVRTNVLAAAFNFSGRLDGYLKGPLRLDLASKVDLSQLPAVLKPLLNSAPFEKELTLLENLQGKATARLFLEGSGGEGKTRLEVSELTASARYRRLPYPIEISSGEVSYGEGRIRVRSLSGAFGKTSFSTLAGQLDLGREPDLDIQSGTLSVSLDEIYAWLSEQESLRDTLKDLKSATGTVGLSEISLKGPLLTPRDWHFRASGNLTAVRVETAFIPGPISVSRGTFGADPERILVSNVDLKILDTELSVSGTLYSYLREVDKLEVDFGGRVTPKDMAWVSDLLHIKHIIHIRPAFSISGGRLSWERGGNISLRADLALEDGLQISFEALQKSRQLKIDRLLVRDPVSDASMKLALQGRRLEFAFSGSLSQRTLAKILSSHREQDGWVRGSFKADIRMDQPLESSVEGRLDVHRLYSPWEFKKPLEIIDIVLEGGGNGVSVTGGSVAWGDRSFSLSGDVRFTPENVLVDLDISTADLHVDEVIKDFGEEKKTTEEKETAGFQLEGRIKFRSQSVSYGRFVWAPFQADVSLAPGRVGIAVTQSNLCGVSMTGRVDVTPQQLSLDVQPLARNQDIDSAAHCFLEERFRTTGAFDLNGRFQGSGESGALARSLQGDAELAAHKGRIFRFDLLSRILSFINVAGVFAGRLPDFRDKGLPYDSIHVLVNLQAGRILIKEATLVGPTVQIASRGEIDPFSNKIDLTVLVAPLRTIDYVIGKIPLINHILGGTLFSIPVTVKGELKDPRVTALSPSAVGSDLLGIMTRTLGLPFQILNPFRRKERTEGEGL